MDNEKIAIRNEEVCTTILVKRRHNNKKIQILNDQISKLELGVLRLEEDTREFSENVCEKAKVSFDFISTILSGRSKKQEEEDGTEEDNNN